MSNSNNIPFPVTNLEPFNETFITAHGLLHGLIDGNATAKAIYISNKTQFDPLFLMMGYLVQIEEGGCTVRHARPLTLEAVKINEGLQNWMKEEQTQKKEKEKEKKEVDSSSILSSAIGSLKDSKDTPNGRLEKARMKARQKLEEKKKLEEQALNIEVDDN